tara:strand:+ start:725 stop:1501 length:777 start_codon:yes stop_codon:yes gene_type:complete
MDPYDVLGISHNATWKDIRKAYKNMLILTHPDRMGNAKYFMLTHEAYSILEKQRCPKERDAPNEKMMYKNEGVGEPIKPFEQYSAKKFNEYFDKNRISATDPYSNGYQKQMCQRLDYQEELNIAKSSKIHIPEERVVLYKEPQSLPSSSMLDSCSYLGIDNVDDYSGGGGTDIMKAYCHRRDPLIDTVKRFNSYEDAMHQRSTQSFYMTEQQKQEKAEIEIQQKRLEQLRLSRVRHNDDRVSRKYDKLQNRLQYKNIG